MELRVELFILNKNENLTFIFKSRGQCSNTIYVLIVIFLCKRATTLKIKCQTGFQFPLALAGDKANRICNIEATLLMLGATYNNWNQREMFYLSKRVQDTGSPSGYRKSYSSGRRQSARTQNRQRSEQKKTRQGLKRSNKDQLALR